MSQDVRRQRSFEQALVGGYQAYLRDLTALSKGRKKASTEEERGLASAAVSCACTLLLAVPHFNFRGELLKIAIAVLGSGVNDQDFQRCRETLENLFREDDDGKPSLDAVGLLTKMMKARNYRIDESVLNTFLHLRLLSEFASKGSQNKIDHADSQAATRIKRRNEKKTFRTKKERRLEKERKIVEKEMREADAAVNHEERDRLQAETLKLVFVTYFRVLKARPPNLMGAVLEGLAKYAHLINQDFFGDLLEVLKDLIREKASSDDVDRDGEGDNDGDDDGICRTVRPSSIRETFLCITTAFALLQGQGQGVGMGSAKVMQTLNLDLGFFVSHLYRSLYAVALDPDIERSAKSLHLPDPQSPLTPNTTSTSESTTSMRRRRNENKINVQTTIVLLLRCLHSVLLPHTSPNNYTRSMPPLRLAAFTKQLMTVSLHLPERSCLSLLSSSSQQHRHHHHHHPPPPLDRSTNNNNNSHPNGGLMAKLMKVHGRKVAGLWRTEEKKVMASSIH